MKSKDLGLTFTLILSNCIMSDQLLNFFIPHISSQFFEVEFNKTIHVKAFTLCLTHGRPKSQIHSRHQQEKWLEIRYKLLFFLKMIHLYARDVLCPSGHQTLKQTSKILIRLEHIQLKRSGK